MSLSLGLQLYSVRDELRKDYWGTLEKLAAIGYRNLEIAVHNADEGLTPRASELRMHLDRLGLRIVSSHISPLDRGDAIIPYLHEIGCPAVGCSIAFFNNKRDVLDFCRRLNQYGEVYTRAGIDFYYHNHFQEFQRFDGQYIMDIIVEHTDPALVKIELDTYWAVRGGVDPIAYLKKLGDRCDLIHQKDLPAGVDPVNLLDTIGEQEEITFEKFLSLLKQEHFTESGEGVLDIAGIVRTAREIGAARYLFVEQDMTARNQLDSVGISYRNMSRLLEQ